jgi:hypothetical protein
MPIIVVLADTSENINTAFKCLEKIVHDGDYVWLFGQGTITPTASDSSNTQYPRYHKYIQCGDAVEARKNEAGTAGLFIRKVNSRRIHGITAGHVFENLHPNQRVIQPALRHLALDIDDIEYRIKRLQTQIKTATQSTLSKYENGLSDFQSRLNVLHALKGANDRETRQNLKVGKIVSHECCPIIYQERQCLSDWGIFEVTRERRPEATEFNEHPAAGVLASKEWNSAKQFGSLRWDQ